MSITSMDIYEDGYNAGYDEGKADAERDFQNSDYWNDYLSKVLADARADERKHIIDILFGIDRQVAYLVKEILNNEQNTGRKL